MIFTTRLRRRALANTPELPDPSDAGAQEALR